MVHDAQSHSAVTALRERVKELTCLYAISQIAGQPDISLNEILQGIVDLLPLYVVSGIARDVPLQTIFRGALPFLAALVIAAIILIAFPQLCLLLPNLVK